MKKANVLWLGLLALVLYIAPNYTSRAQAQQQSTPTTVRLTKIDPYRPVTVQVSGRIVGFSCVSDPVEGGKCFVATTD